MGKGPSGAVALEVERPQLGQGPNKKRQLEDVGGDEMGEKSSYADKVLYGNISEDEKAYLLRTLSEDFTRMAGKPSEGKVVFQAKASLNMGKALSGLHRAMACGIFFYFMGKPPSEDEFRRWFNELYGDRVSLQKYHFAGRGFFQALVETPLQREYVLATVAAFKGSLVFTVPWSPAIQPEEMLLHQCPVWVELPNLPFYLWDQVREVVSALGKVLFVPPETQECKAVKKACILWDRSQETPDFLNLDVEGFKVCVEVKFQTFPDACYKCRKTGHFARDCPGTQTTANLSVEEKATPQESKEPADKPGSSKSHADKEQSLSSQKEAKQGSNAAKDEGWKQVQAKKNGSKAGQPIPKPLQEITNKGKKGNLKKMARNSPKPLATLLEDKENLFAIVNLSDE